MTDNEVTHCNKSWILPMYVHLPLSEGGGGKRGHGEALNVSIAAGRGRGYSPFFQGLPLCLLTHVGKQISYSSYQGIDQRIVTRRFLLIR